MALALETLSLLQEAFRRIFSLKGSLRLCHSLDSHDFPNPQNYLYS